MFKASFRFPFLRIVRELLHYLQIAPHQLTPNAWRVFFACVILWPKVLGEGKNLSIQEFLKIYKLMENLGAEYIFDFQAQKPTKFIQLTGYPNNKVWRKKFFFVQGDWEFSLIEIIKDPNVPRETRLPLVAGREEPILNQDEEAQISRLQEYAQKDPSRMDFGAIFSLIVLAAYLRYPQIEGVNDELVRKRKNADPKASRSQSLEAKRSKISSFSKSELTIEVTR
jgi:hypothetical protein